MANIDLCRPKISQANFFALVVIAQETSKHTYISGLALHGAQRRAWQHTAESSQSHGNQQQWPSLCSRGPVTTNVPGSASAAQVSTGWPKATSEVEGIEAAVVNA